MLCLMLKKGFHSTEEEIIEEYIKVDAGVVLIP